MKLIYKHGKNIIASLVFMIILFLTIHGATVLLTNKGSIEKYGDMKNTDQYDVLFMGNSHVLCGIAPLELWNDYGIVSYNCGGNANQLPTTYHVMRNILTQYQPKVVVIDVYCLESNEKVISGRAGVDCQHVSLDWLPLSKEKIEAADYLFDDIQTKMEFIAPIWIYHDRWTELNENDFNTKYSVTKGAAYPQYHSGTREFTLIDQDDMNLEDSLGKQYLCKIIEECQSRGIEVLIVNIPYPATVEQQQWANSVQVIADQYDVNYLNMFYEDTGLNFDTDCLDADSHLNASGESKVTDYLGNYLCEHYDLSDRRSDAEYSDWHQDYREYSAYKWQTIVQAKENVRTYLSLMHDKNLNTCIYYKGDSDMRDNQYISPLVQNIAELEKLQEACTSGEDYFAVIDRGNDTIYEYVGNEALDNLQTSFAKISLSENVDGARCLKLDNGDLDYLKNGNGVTSELVLISYDKSTGELVDWAKFDITESILGS